ncbi:MAG: PAS domain-containing protein, partial [Thermodesulfobacteriota bacterium]
MAERDRARQRHGVARSLLPYGVAMGTTALALGLTLLFQPALAATPSVLFHFAVIGSTWMGGLPAGLVATLGATLALDYFFLAPLYAVSLLSAENLILSGVFAGVSVVFSLLTAARKRTEAELQATREELAVHLAEMTRLHEFSNRLSTHLDLQPLLRDVLATVTSLQHTDMGALQLYDAERKELSFAATLGLPEAYVARVGRQPAGSGACGTAVATRQPVIVEDVDTDPRIVPYREAVRLAGFRATYSLPLLTRSGKVVGTLAIHFRDRRRPSPHELQLVGLYARQAAEALEHARLYQAAQEARAQAETLQRRYQDLVHSVPAIVWEGDPQTFQFTFVSQRAEALLGYPVARWLAEPAFWVEHIHPEDRERVVATCRQATAEGRDHEFEYRIAGADGRVVWLHDFVYVVADGTGRPQHLRGLMVDITARKAAEEALRESEQRWRTLAEAMPALVWMARPDGFVEYYNQRWCDYTGLPAEQLAGWGWEAVWHPEDLPAGRARWQEALRAGQPYEYEARLRRADGSFRWHLIRAVPLREVGGQVLRWLGTTTDIDAQKRSAAELRRSNEELQQFAYVASHDLQEPLRMVSLYVELLAKRYRGRLDADADEFIGYAVEGARRMKALIDGLLAYSRVESRGQALQPTDSEAVLAQVLTDLQPAIAEGGATITHEPLPLVRADALQLGQVLQNLLSNALKFRNAAPPQIRVSARQEGNEWVMAVRDNGIGIDPRHAARLFQMFQRLHARDKYPGTGIGLA